MVDLANTIWRDFNTAGIPASGKKKPTKSKIREWGTYLESLTTAAQYGNTVWFATKSALNADLAHALGVPAIVYADTTAANNGIYIKAGASGTGSWGQIITYLPGYQFVTATDAGAGTANAIVATSSPRVAYTDGVQLIRLNIYETNTSGTVTVAFDGGAALTIQTASGNPPSVGGLTAGMTILGVVDQSASVFRMLSDQASAAILPGAEAAAAQSEAWAEGTEPGGVGTKSSKEWALIAAGGVALGSVSFSFTGDGAETDFTLAVTPSDDYSVRAFIDGVSQKPATAYTTSGTTLSFSEAPPDGAAIFGYVITVNEVSIGTPDAGSVGASEIDTGEAAAIMSAIDGQALYAACQGRLTLTSATAVTTSDVTAAGTLYWTPYIGGRIWLYSGSLWTSFAPGELSIALSGGTASRLHDVFMDYNAGTPQLALTAWTDDTTRATALALQDGILVKSGSTGQRYLGTIYLDASKQCADSFAKRHVWNLYNRKPRPMRVLESTASWNYTTETVRQANGVAGNQLDFVQGLSEDAVKAEVLASAYQSGASNGYSVLIGLDSTTAAATGCLMSSPTQHVAGGYIQQVSAAFEGFSGAGRHVLTWLEWSQDAGTTTWIGTLSTPLTRQSGIFGTVYA